ncbi:hypothetical protein D3C87_583390 [compost metagenome]
MPPYIVYFLEGVFPYGVELDRHLVFKHWPADFGHNVFDNSDSNHDATQTIFKLRKEIVGQWSRLVVVDNRCYLFAFDNDEGHKWLAMMKLTYG